MNKSSKEEEHGNYSAAVARSGRVCQTGGNQPAMVLDEEAVRKHIRTSLQAARGCKMEITQRDVYTIHNDIAKAKRYVDIIREEIENNWKN